jgi:hypothetical protein
VRALQFRLTPRAVTLAAAVILIAAPSAVANTIDVTATGDSTSAGCNLRSAITAANNDSASAGCPAGSGADTVVLHTATYTLAQAGRDEINNATGDLNIRSSITLTGDGPEKSIIDAAGIDRVIDISALSNTVVLKNLTVTGGNVGAQPAQAPTTGNSQTQDVTANPGASGADGGGIRSVGTLTVDHVNVRDNTAGAGGAGGNATHNFPRSATGGAGGQGGNGGGIACYNTLNVIDSRITGNAAGAGGNGGSGTGGSANFIDPQVGAGTGGLGGTGGKGGGIYTLPPPSIQRSVIASNRAGNGGSGGTAVGADQLDSAVGGAHPGGAANGGSGGPGGNGGGIELEPSGGTTTTITDTTVSDNSAGNGGPGQTAKGGKGASTSAPAGKATGGSGGFGGSGGGIVDVSGPMDVKRSTLSGNEAGNGSTGAFATAGQNGPAPDGPPGSPPPPTTFGDAKGGRGGDGGSGGALVAVGPGTKTVSDATVDSNSSGSGGQGGGATGSFNGGNGGGAGSGGGLDSHQSPLAIMRATISSNTVGTRGVGVAGGGNGVIGLGSAIWSAATTSVTGSIIAENGPTNRCTGAITDGGSNIDFPADSGCPGANVDPLLGALAANGGLTQTRALASGSPAIDLFTCGSATDQRGVARPAGSTCDAGAYEFALPAITGVSATADASSVAFGAQVTPYAASATVTFDYGKDESYGSAKTQAISGGVTTPTAVTLDADALDPGTLYHFRVRATSNAGTTTSADGTFRTADVPAGGGAGPNPSPTAPADVPGPGPGPAPGPDPLQPLPLSGVSFPSAKLAPSLSRGYETSFTAPGAGRATLVLSASGGDARGLRTVVARTVRVASGSKRVTKAGKVKVTAKFTKKARSKLRRKRKVKLTAVLTFKDASGRTGTSKKKVTLKR